MSVQTQNYTMTAQKLNGTDDPVRVEGQDGAFAMVDATLLYRLDADQATDVYRAVGADYQNKLVKPSARSCIRLEFTGYDMVGGRDHRVEGRLRRHRELHHGQDRAGRHRAAGLPAP